MMWGLTQNPRLQSAAESPIHSATQHTAQQTYGAAVSMEAPHATGRRMGLACYLIAGAGRRNRSSTHCTVNANHCAQGPKSRSLTTSPRMLYSLCSPASTQLRPTLGSVRTQYPQCLWCNPCSLSFTANSCSGSSRTQPKPPAAPPGATPQHKLSSNATTPTLHCSTTHLASADSHMTRILTALQFLHP